MQPRHPRMPVLLAARLDCCFVVAEPQAELQARRPPRPGAYAQGFCPAIRPPLFTMDPLVGINSSSEFQGWGWQSLPLHHHRHILLLLRL